MTYTYDVTTPVGQVRLYANDRDISTPGDYIHPYLADEEILALLGAVMGNIYLAAAAELRIKALDKQFLKLNFTIGSPALNAGKDMSAYYTTDFNGETRTSWTLGALNRLTKKPMKLSLILTDGSSTNLMMIQSHVNAAIGTSITVADGTSSGKKITIVNGATTETYDNLASVAAAVSAININSATTSMSTLVKATIIAEGTLGNISATQLASRLKATRVVAS